MLPSHEVHEKPRAFSETVSDSLAATKRLTWANISDDDDSDFEFPVLSLASCTSVESTRDDEVESGASSHRASAWTMKRVKGLSCVVVSAFSYSIVAVCVKIMSRHVSWVEAVFWRMSIALVTSCVWMCCKNRGLAVHRKYWAILLFRGVMGTLSVNLKFYAMCNMVLTDAVAIIFTSPIFTFLLGATILGEAVGRIDVIATLMAFVGLLFVTRPEFLFPPSENAATKAPASAIISALGASVVLAVVYVTLRKMRGIDSLISIQYYLTFGTSYALLSLWAFNESLHLSQEPLCITAIVGSGLFAYIGQVFLAMGFKYEKAGIASVMRYFDVVFVLVWDVTVLDERVATFSIIGALIIFVGATLIVLDQARMG